MNKFYYSIVMCCFFLLSACSQSEPVFYEISGKQIQFSHYHGKWVIINYWAKWCRSCIEEIPMLNAFYQQNKNSVVVLGVNYDSLPAEDLKYLVKQLNIEFPVLQQDPGEYLKLGVITAVPTTIIINPQGKVVKSLLGPQTAVSLAKAIR